MSSDTTLRGIGQKSSTGDAPRDKAAGVSGAPASKDASSAKPLDARSLEKTDKKPGEPKAAEAKPADSKPGDSKPTDAGQPQGGATVNTGKRGGPEPRRSEIRPSLGTKLGVPLRSLDSTVPGARSLDSSVPGAPASLDSKVPNLAATLIGVAAPVFGPSVSLFGGAKGSEATKDPMNESVNDSTPMLPGISPPPKAGVSGIPVRRDAATTLGHDVHLTTALASRLSGRGTAPASSVVVGVSGDRGLGTSGAAEAAGGDGKVVAESEEE
ncbi:MAG TPA: hypothetical protein VIU64_01320, partial [Polyangia bacterium]